MKLHQMRAFQAVAALGTVTRAAAELSISQPAISRTIHQLEEELGLALFEMVQGRLVPTAHARALLPQITRVLSQIQDIGRHAADLRDGKRGVLRIASTPSCAVAMVKAGLESFRIAAPGALIDVVTARTTSVIDMVASGQTDIGFCQISGMENGILSHLSIRGSVVCVMSADHPLAEKREISPADLEREPLITYSQAELTGMRIAAAFAQQGVQPSHAVLIGQTLPAIGLAGEGFGIALVDSFFGADLDFAREPGLPDIHRALRVVPFVPTIPIDLHLLTPGGRPLTYLTEVFLDTFLERYGGPGVGRTRSDPDARPD